MKDYTRSFAGLVSTLILTLILLCSLAGAQSNSLSGSFGFLVNQYPVDPSGSGGAILGVMNLDGAGNVAGSYTFQNPNDKTITGAFTGTYSAMPNGVGFKPGSMTLSFDVGFSVSFDMVIIDSGQGLQLVATNCSGGCDLGGTVVSGVARAAYTGTVSGSYGFQLSSTPVPSAFLGVMSFDGAGNAAMSITNVGAPKEGSPPPVGGGTLKGTYSPNPDGSGTITLIDPSGNPNQTFAMVATDGGSGLLLVLTSGPGINTTVSSGTARLQ